MNRRFRTLLFAVVSALEVSVCQGQVATCTNLPGTSIDVVFVRLNYLGNTLREGDRLLAFFMSLNIKTDMTRSEEQWSIDLSNSPGIGTVQLRELETSFKPYRTGWDFGLHRGNPLVRNERIKGGSRCVARFLFDAIPVWRLRVTAFPQTLALPVSCGEPCGRDAKTEFVTKQIPATQKLTMVVDAGGPCNYPLTVDPQDVFPKKVSSKEIIDSLLMESQCNQWERTARRVRIPSEIQIHVEP